MIVITGKKANCEAARTRILAIQKDLVGTHFSMCGDFYFYFFKFKLGLFSNLVLFALINCHVVQANISEVDVSIPSKLHNSLIGSKGRLVRSIMEECGGVHIHFPTEGSGIDKVTIRGPAEEVEKAKQQLLALAEEKVCKYVSELKLNFCSTHCFEVVG